jgi:hypothetical protein
MIEVVKNYSDLTFGFLNNLIKTGKVEIKMIPITMTSICFFKSIPFSRNTPYK